MSNPFKTQLQEWQYLDKYSRFNREAGRRETWSESVQRSVDYLRELSHNRLSEKDYQDIYNAMYQMDAFCSMRLFAMAGEAARRDNTVLYNCSYLPVNSLEAMAEALYLSMSGCGVGYSIESRYVNLLPTIAYQVTQHPTTIHVIPDTQEGWADAFLFGLREWVNGNDVEFDYSEIRPAGTVLKTKGGRASGHQVLADLLDLSRSIILNAQGRKLRPIEAHDIMASIGDCARSGGSRRSAMICLFDHNDEEMLHAKDYGWWKARPQRANANNSIAIENRLSRDELADIMYTMNDGASGEPGLFIRKNAVQFAPRRSDNYLFGINPCGEISLRSNQFCNLSQAITRSDDTLDTLVEKIRIATIIGTIQSMATSFKYIRDVWRKNTEQERLLGVDITGQLDAPHLFTDESLSYLRQVAIDTNLEYATKLGINQSAAITCNKPSGNSSILFDCSAGIHSRWADYYIRRVRVDVHSPFKRLFDFCGVKLHPENGQKLETANTFVAEFPMKAPEGAITNGSRSAMSQLEWWRMNKIYWTEHNPSATISYRPHELEEVIDWLYDNQDIVGGLSFLPYDDHTYPLAPYEKIDKDTYETMIKNMPNIDFDLLHLLESEDNTTIAQELACSSGICEI